jgi:uncharacterized membrane protein YcjF (UPF0283 family)
MDAAQQSDGSPLGPGDPRSTDDLNLEEASHSQLLYIHVPHPYIARRKAEGPVKSRDLMNRGNPIARLNSRLALAITIGVGSMWCAYLFALLAFVSFPSAIATGDKIIIVAWVAQTFLQLVLLPVIIVGQNLQAAASDKRAEQTYNDADAVLHEALHIQKHLSAQDAHLQEQDRKLQEIVAAVGKILPSSAG